MEIVKYKTGVINNPLGQPRPTVIVAWFWTFGMDGRTDDTLWENSDYYRPGLWSASWINKPS